MDSFKAAPHHKSGNAVQGRFPVPSATRELGAAQGEGLAADIIDLGRIDKVALVDSYKTESCFSTSSNLA